MAELKTQRNDASVADFVAGIEDEKRRADATALIELMGRVSGSPATMWGTGMVGFGEYSYRYASGQSGTWFILGFAPRKQNTTLYLYGGMQDEETVALRAALGPHSTGKGCLYVKRLSAVDPEVLEQLVRRAHARAVQEAAEPA
jgi:hypothetical protein